MVAVGVLVLAASCSSGDDGDDNADRGDSEAPVSTLTGDADPGESIICVLFGGVTPFDAETLATLYPTHDDYVEAVTAAADASVTAGFLLSDDRDEIVNAAEDAPIPS